MAGVVGALPVWIRPAPATRLHFAFARAVERGEAEAKSMAADCVFAAGKKDWRAAAWWLSHRDRENFGDKQKFEMKQVIQTIIKTVEDVLGEQSALAVYEGVRRTPRPGGCSSDGTMESRDSMGGYEGFWALTRGGW